MLFNSLEFLLFFPVTTILFFLLPHRFRWMLLLAASCFFYMFFKPIYIVILAFTIVIDYFAGIWIESASTPEKKQRYLLLSLIANIGVLAIFKYYNFIGFNVNTLLDFSHSSWHMPLLKILLPIGLSFHTFQAMSYTIEVARGNQKAERHFGIYALYVMFYPQLVAGPIERPQNMLHQFHKKHFFDRERVVSGLQLMLQGLFKKVVIADRLAQFSDRYNDPSAQTGMGLAVASFFFAFQIYCDFSGYSDIALGSARVMGFDLMVNFNNPFISKNITEFWRRWHISLSTWFNDYLFKPFAVSFRDWGNWAVIIGLLLTFSLSGLWHGAGWTFVIYGVLHGCAVVFEFVTKKLRKKVAKKTPTLLYNTVSQILTFGFVVFAWVFFRADTVQNAFVVLRKIPHLFHELDAASLKSELFGTEARLSFLLIFCLIVYNGSGLRNYFNTKFLGQPRYVRWSVYFGAIYVILFFGVFGNRNFIYFQF